MRDNYDLFTTNENKFKSFECEKSSCDNIICKGQEAYEANGIVMCSECFEDYLDDYREECYFEF